MSLWKVYHPAGAYTAQDKKDLSERITGMYARVPIPKFYVGSVHIVNERNRQEAVIHLSRILPAIRSEEV